MNETIILLSLSILMFTNCPSFVTITLIISIFLFKNKIFPRFMVSNRQINSLFLNFTLLFRCGALCCIYIKHSAAFLPFCIKFLSFFTFFNYGKNGRFGVCSSICTNYYFIKINVYFFNFYYQAVAEKLHTRVL